MAEEVEEVSVQLTENGVETSEEVSKGGAEVVEKVEQDVNETIEETLVETVKEPPKPVKRIPRPSKEERDELINAQKEIRIQASENLAKLRDGTVKIKIAKRDAKLEVEALSKQKDEYYHLMREKIEARKAIVDQSRALKQQDYDGNSKNSLKDLPRALKYCTTVEDVEKRIKELEYIHITESLTTKEEKSITGEINYLKHSGLEIMSKIEQQREEFKASKEDRKKEREELEKQRKALDAEIKTIQAKYDAQKKDIEQMREAQKSIFNELRTPIEHVDYETEKQKKTDAKAEIDRLIDDYNTRYKEFKETEDKFFAYERYKRLQKSDAIKARKEEELLKKEAELAELEPTDPYEGQKAMCRSLLLYLQALDPSLIIEDEKQTAKTSGETRTPQKPVARKISDSSGAEAIGKSALLVEADDGYAALSKGKKGKRGKGSKSSSDGDKKMPKHSMEAYTAFAKLGIKAPTSRGEVPSTFEAVKEKQEYYRTALPPAETEEKKDAAQKSGAKKPPTVPKSQVVVDGDFPEGEMKSADASLAMDLNRPSFKDIIAGNAAVPPTDFPKDLGGPSKMEEIAGAGDSTVVTEGVDDDTLNEDIAAATTGLTIAETDMA